MVRDVAVASDAKIDAQRAPATLRLGRKPLVCSRFGQIADAVINDGLSEMPPLPDPRARHVRWEGG